MAESHLSVTGANNKMISVCKTKRDKSQNRKKKKKVTKSKLHWWTLGLKGEKRGKGGGRRRRRRDPSDGQRDEAVVLLDVSFENVRAGTQDALEARSVQLHTLQGAAGDHSGSAGAVHQQGNLTWRTHTETHRKCQIT